MARDLFLYRLFFQQVTNRTVIILTVCLDDTAAGNGALFRVPPCASTSSYSFHERSLTRTADTNNQVCTGREPLPEQYIRLKIVFYWSAAKVLKISPRYSMSFDICNYMLKEELQQFFIILHLRDHMVTLG
jgi:hypothetical protein